jgi:CRISPR-associated protein Cmr6
MPQGRVIQWNGRTGYLQATSGQRLFFGDRDLFGGLRPGDVQEGMEVEFDGPFQERARRVRRRDTSAVAQSAQRGAVSSPFAAGPRGPHRVPRWQANELPVPRRLRTRIEGIPLAERHPGLQLDKYLRPCPKQEQQRDALTEVVRPRGDPALFDEVRQRRVDALPTGAECWRRTTSAPLTLHLARASALENAGICLHPIYGFTYLPGTGLKGMARAYAETVWLPGETDRVAAWQEIEAVFGWAPGSDQIGKGVEKPWKPAGIPGHEANPARSGSVVFHDAWPERWPELTVDIVNNHHGRYYQEGDVPGDWDTPVPVYFLAVRPGATFEFALSARRSGAADRGAELVRQAREWLDGALTLLGCGAKTAAGYGAFRPEGPRPTLSVEWAEWSGLVELVTPGFLAGADQAAPDNCDLRGATLRGLLRWWWRTLHSGFLTLPELRSLEATLWGDTSAGAAIQIQVERDHSCRPELFNYKDRFNPRPDFKARHNLRDRPNNRTTQGLFYASYGMDEMSQGQRKQRFYLDAGCRWVVRLTARETWFFEDPKQAAKPKERERGLVIPAREALDQGRAALWLLCHYGAVGSKARKGFGSLRLQDESLGPLDLARCRDLAARLRAERLGRGAGFDAARTDSPALEEALGLPDEYPTPWSDPWKAMDEIGFVYQAFAQDFAHRPDKVALGLPRKIHGPRDDGPMPGQKDWQPPEWLDFPLRPRDTQPSNARHASPVHIHLDRGENGRLIVRVVAFPSPCLPDRESSRVFLEGMLEHFRRELSPLATQAPVPAPARSTPVTAPGSGRRPEGTPARVKVLEPHEKGGKGAFFVQEEGKPRGTLRAGTPPATLPEPGDIIDVYVSSDDPRSPQYRWDRPSAPPPKGRGGPGGGRPRR